MPTLILQSQIRTFAALSVSANEDAELGFSDRSGIEKIFKQIPIRDLVQINRCQIAKCEAVNYTGINCGNMTCAEYLHLLRERWCVGSGNLAYYPAIREPFSKTINTKQDG